MKTKTILALAIIATTPFSAQADRTYVDANTPAEVGDNGTVYRTQFLPPYVIASIGEHDDEHIATTAYVKGAYNDVIRAVNVLGQSKQEVLTNNSTGDEMPGSVNGAEDFVYALASGNLNLESAELRLLSEAAVAAGIKSQRVEIWTTWDDDSAKTDVAFKTVVPED